MILAGDFISLCFSLEPSGQSLFNVMAVYFNKPHRFGRFKCVFLWLTLVGGGLLSIPLVQVKMWQSSHPAPQTPSINILRSSWIYIKVALLLTLISLCKPTARPFHWKFPFPAIVNRTPCRHSSVADCEKPQSGASVKVKVTAFIV